MKIIALTTALTVLAGTTAAQSFYKQNVPDFDQRRSACDNQGKMYCVPTSALNWMGYIANHGKPQAMGHPSSNWASQSEYSLATNRLNKMADLMDTSATGGTDTGDAVEGLADYFDLYGVGPALMLGYIADEDWQVQPAHIYNYLKMGCLVNICYGRYELDGDQWERTGGHCVTACAIENASSSSPRLGFRDPDTGSSDSYTQQSTFMTRWWDLKKWTHNFDGDVYSQWGPIDNSGSTRRFIDKIIVVMPFFALTPDLNTGGLKTLIIPFQESQEPTEKVIHLPQSQLPLGAFADPKSPGIYIIGKASKLVNSKLFKHDPVKNDTTPLMDLPANPGAFTIDKLGDLLLEINGDLHKYRILGDGSVKPLGSAKLGSSNMRVAVDDKTGDVWVLLIPGHKLIKYPGGDLASPAPAPINPDFVIGGVTLFDINPITGKPWISTNGDTRLLELSFGRLGFEPSDSLNMGKPPESFEFDPRGGLAVVCDGSVKEFITDPLKGVLVPSDKPAFGGVPAKGFFVRGKSRSNFNPLLHTGPAWANLEDPGDTSAEIADCPADFNFDGFADAIDYDQFIRVFDASDIQADVNGDGFVDAGDLDQFIRDWVKGC